ncbi:MAG: glycoside hydrolase family 1 protein [bacterium]|nr:glycoside hydrolase family 1 protein [bacterium]
MQQGNFLFGASTSAHQVEGGNSNNDWWEWEKTRPKDFQSGRAADSWNRYREDIALAKKLGHTAHRLSLEWSRIETQEGRFNSVAIARYREILQELQLAGIKTFVTLHHFTNPIWLARGRLPAGRQGWESKKTPELFARYVKYVAQELGDLVDFWITINEPMVYASQSFVRGVWPPQKKNIFAMVRVIRNMARAHRLAYKVLHKANPRIPIGFAKHLIAYTPESKTKLTDRIGVALYDWFFNHMFFLLIRNKQDFIGVNYYFARTLRVRMFPFSISEVLLDVPKTDLGWPIYAKGLMQTLLHMKQYKKPIYITENGLADAADSKRADFIRSHIRAIEAAQKQGCDVRGYLHWSLIDNFEWAEGFVPRFGLIEIDYATQKRTIRPSAYVYKAIIEQSKGV